MNLEDKKTSPRGEGQRAQKNKRRIIVGATICCVALIMILQGILESRTLVTTYFEIESDRLPEAFDGFKIAHISDTHNAEFGGEDGDRGEKNTAGSPSSTGGKTVSRASHNSDLISILEEEKPDIIAITGDLVDSRHTDVDIAAEFMEEAMKIAPCYYVIGNHETRVLDDFWQLEKRLDACGVEILHNRVTEIERGGQKISLAGVDDPMMYSSKMSKTMEKYVMLRNLNAVSGAKLSRWGRLPESEQEYKILLVHRPEHFDFYAEEGYDLVLSGHTHGGQFRLPFVGAFFLPSEGFFPKYAGGRVHRGRTDMIVSRGLGNSLVPLRLYNKPEVVIEVLRRG